MILLVSYQLKSVKDYSEFYNVLKSAPAWWHYLDSVWIIQTDDTPSTLIEKLKPHFDQSLDAVLIVDITGKQHNGWLPQKAWDWINTHS